MEYTNDNDGKTISIIAYLTLIGWIIAIIMNGSKRNETASFHIRQMLGLMLLFFTISIITMSIPLGFLGSLLSIFLLILWVIGFVGAIQGERKLIPLLGESFQQWFKGIK